MPAFVDLFSRAVFGHAASTAGHIPYSTLEGNFKRTLNKPGGRLPVQILAPVVVVDTRDGDSFTKGVNRATVASQNIEAGRILGVWDGEILLSTEFKYKVDLTTRYEKEKYVCNYCPIKILIRADHSSRPLTYQTFLIRQFEKITWNAPQPNHAAMEASPPEGETLDILITLDNDPSVPGYWLSEVNDVTTQPDQRSVMEWRTENVARVEVLIFGWPFAFLVARSNIAAGEELLLKYDNDDWDDQRNALEDYKIYQNLLQPLSKLPYDRLLKIPHKTRVLHVPPANEPVSMEAVHALNRELEGFPEHLADLSMTLNIPNAVLPGLHHDLEVTQGKSGEPVEFVPLSAIVGGLELFKEFKRPYFLTRPEKGPIKILYNDLQ
ncbi:hypothetical protein BC830DRAFT_806353 [Chytriomyces sp. MP71]|nr:hypothetical protein BC830DRAFT_806353 [Chytriomyces sp. MP71]